MRWCQVVSLIVITCIVGAEILADLSYLLQCYLYDYQLQTLAYCDLSEMVSKVKTNTIAQTMYVLIY